MTAGRATAAAAVLLLYTLWCLTLWRRQRRLQRDHAREAAALQPGVGNAAPVLVAFASQTGFAEQVAWHTARALHAAGVPALLKPLDAVQAAELQASRRALFIVSTTGEGDAPDAAAPFVRRCMQAALPLAPLEHAVLALGDSAYEGFCGFGRRLDGWLQAQGARTLFERIEVDNGDAHALQRWRQALAHLAGTADLPDWQAPAFDTWRLAARTLLNPGSAGAPLYRVELEAVDARPDWQAGDLAQVQLAGEPGRPREYSVASLPGDARLELLVRRVTRDDGSDGAASGWLTRSAPLGAAVALRLRAHPQFRIGDNTARRLLLVGNGSGFAGLRAHLKARAAQPAAQRAPCWLVYGERQAAHDAHARGEVDAWLRAGVLAHADLVFSRDQPERRYVQHRLRDAAERLREWVAQGAAIYVCGSFDGMAEGVDAALREVLGTTVVEQLGEQGRYRRDVY